MKIGLDYISSFGGAGAGTYSRELIKNLALIDKENSYYLYTYLHKKFFNQAISQLIQQDNFKYRFIILPYLTANKCILPILRLLRKAIFSLNYKLDNLDLFHLTNPVNYYQSLDNFVITVHDLAPFYNKNFVKSSTFFFFQKYFKEMITRAKVIIAVSNFTKNDILERFNLPEDKIKVIFEGADNLFRPTKNPAVLKKYGLQKKYLLSVGQLQPRKNLQTLLKAYSLLPKNLKNEYDLVLVGSPRDEASLNQLKKIINQEKISHYVKTLGYVALNDLPVLYSRAYIFVYLSLLEGFGLPVLESLQCGRPVLIADNSSLPEVAGSAGLTVNPKNIGEIVLKMEEILKNQALIESLVGKISSQIKNFSWLKTGRETLEVYQKAVYPAPFENPGRSAAGVTKKYLNPFRGV